MVFLKKKKYHLWYTFMVFLKKKKNIIYGIQTKGLSIIFADVSHPRKKIKKYHLWYKNLKANKKNKKK